MKEITIKLDDESFRLAEDSAARRGISVEDVIREILVKLGGEDLSGSDPTSESGTNSEE